MGWSIGCCDVELSRGSCPSNSANDVQKTRMDAVGGSDLKSGDKWDQRLYGVQGDIKGGSRVYDRNMGRINTTHRRHIRPWKRWPPWRNVYPRRIPRAAEDLARTAAEVCARALLRAALCGSRDPRPFSTLHSIVTIAHRNHQRDK